jgi:hypothetical protein
LAFCLGAGPLLPTLLPTWPAFLIFALNVLNLIQRRWDQKLQLLAGRSWCHTTDFFNKFLFNFFCAASEFICGSKSESVSTESNSLKKQR